jgi:cytochrome c553
MQRDLRVSWLVRGVIAVGAGCGAPAREAPPPPPPSGLAAEIEAAQHRMHLRFTAAVRIEQAIAHSDLPRAHAEAHELTELEEPAALATWQPYFAAIRDAARQVDAAGDVIAASRVTAQLGRQCARCHEAIAARVAFPVEPPPAGDAKLVIQMLGHQWAAAQMWQGLLGPSDGRWQAGARALTTAPLNTVAQAVTPTSDVDVDDVARIRMYARRALTTGAQDERAELFGTMLATCAHCHAVLRDR